MSRVVITEPIESAAPVTIELPESPADHIAAFLDAWGAQGLSVADRRSSMRLEAGSLPDALKYYVVLSEFVNRWVDVTVNRVPVDFERVYEESRKLPDAGKPAEVPQWAQVGGDDPGHMPHAVVETAEDLVPETVSMIRYAYRLRLVPPPARTKAAFVTFARVAGIRLGRQRRLPFLSTGREPEPLNKKGDDQGVDLERLRLQVIPHRKDGPPQTYDVVPPRRDRRRYRALSEANAEPVTSVLTRLGCSQDEESGVWTCPRAARRPGHPQKPTVRVEKNRARCLTCDAAPLTSAGLVAATLDVTPDEAASLILEPGRAAIRPDPAHRRPELVALHHPGTLVTAYVSAGRPDRFDCVIYDAGVGHPREAIIWRPDTANLPADVAPLELQPGDVVTALVMAAEGGTYELSIDAPELAARAIASQVPEIIEGAVEVVAVARKPGSRAKVVVAPTVPNLNTVGVCLGKRDNHYHLLAAHRVLNRHRWDRSDRTWERLEVIAFTADRRTYLMNAMRPVIVSDVRIRGRQAVVAVSGLQYRGGVGRGGLNAELAGHLTDLMVHVVAEGADLDAEIQQRRP
ncbi:hypothetical protein [Streptomyces fungicidicus]|uniref:hypothetical protein n=1 Tax=Streptomyces fungicidicus TaxID=68203 RepID=UPI0033E72BDF